MATGKVWRCEKHGWCGIGDCPMCKEDEARNNVFDAAMAYCRSLETNAPCGERDELFSAMLDACKKAEEVERGD